MTADARLEIEGLLGKVADLRAELDEIAGTSAEAAPAAVDAATSPPSLPDDALLDEGAIGPSADLPLAEPPLPPGGSNNGGETP